MSTKTAWNQINSGFTDESAKEASPSISKVIIYKLIFFTGKVRFMLIHLYTVYILHFFIKR